MGEGGPLAVVEGHLSILRHPRGYFDYAIAPLNMTSELIHIRRGGGLSPPAITTIAYVFPHLS
ncbi:MAG: hypothetical protein IJY70_03630 [Clostridia bacterium]|nr:hypothetical protein [Clostridia bacterium]